MMIDLNNSSINLYQIIADLDNESTKKGDAFEEMKKLL